MGRFVARAPRNDGSATKKPAVIGDGRLWFGMQEDLPPYATQRLLIS